MIDDARTISHERVMAAFADINRMLDQRRQDNAHSDAVSVDLGQQ